MNKQILSFFLLIFIAAPLFASEVKLWKDSSTEDLQKGTLKGVSILNSGAIVLSPRVKPWSEQEEQRKSLAFYWDQVQDASGNLYVGTGNEGLLLKITEDGKESIFFQAEEYEITALAIDKNNNIYAGTSPRGKIYKIKKEGQSKIFCELEERYIWNLTFDSLGNLYAATGERGLIFKISEEGDYEVFYDSSEPHIVSLNFDPKGNLLAGSDGNGLLYKISPLGEAEILFASGMREISSISTGKDGAIYISALSDLRRDLKPPLLELKLQELVSAAELERRAAESAMEQSPEKKFKALLEGFPTPEEKKLMEKHQSVIFRLSGDGEAEKITHLSGEKIFALQAAQDGFLYFGTGEPARLYRLEAKGKSTLLHQFEESQATSILPMKYSGWSVLTSNPGGAYKISNALESSGSFLALPYDTKMKSDWGTISCHFEAKPGTGVELFTRSGNNPHPNSEWSSWSRSYNPSTSEAIESPPARFIQWKAELTRVGSSDTPILRSVSLSYRERNKSPEIASFSLIDPGRSMPLAPGKEDPKTNDARKRVIEKGEKGLTWVASDPNNDVLLFTLYYRSEHGTSWQKLDQIGSESSFLWKHSDIPEGAYTLRLIADDSPSNYLGEEKSSEIFSEPFVIDHTPPQITFEKEASGDQLLLEIKAEDAIGKISKMLSSPDQKKWFLLKPTDGICDSSTEQFKFSQRIKPPQSIFLKCLDDSLNETLIEVK